MREATTLALHLPKGENVQVDLWNWSGQRVATLIEPTFLEAGQYHYEWQCNRVAAGSYFVVLNGQVAGKLVIVR